MKVQILYHPNSEQDTPVNEFVREYQRRTGKDIELVSLETRDGAATASLYDIVQYPAIIALENDGVLQHSWQGSTFPLIDEVSYYDTSNAV